MESIRNPQLDDGAIRRIEAIKQSLRGFVLGMIGVLPLIGIAPAIGTLWISSRVRSRLGKQWNPASAYLKCGVVLAVLGLVISSLLIGVLLLEYL
jgi:hypothetical protein